LQASLTKGEEGFEGKEKKEVFHPDARVEKGVALKCTGVRREGRIRKSNI